MEAPRLYAVGDVHGDVERLLELLEGIGLVAGNAWRGGENALVLTGDLTDRGKHGMEVVRLVMRLQRESNGMVESLMGNHDALILARAYEYRGQRADPDCRDLFIGNGGREVEARSLAEDDEAFAWMRSRPLMLTVGDTLFQHADSARFYAALGSDEDAVNAAGEGLAATARGAWRIFYEMTDGRAWDADGPFARNRREASVAAHLERFGAERVVHGHTRHTEKEPVVGFGGRAINVDGTLSEGYRRTPGRGFAADLGPLTAPPTPSGE